MSLLTDAAENLHYPEFSGKTLGLGSFFQFSLDQVKEVIVLGELPSNNQIDESGTVARNVFFLNLQFHKSTVIFFIAFASIYRPIYFVFFSELKLKTKNVMNTV